MSLGKRTLKLGEKEYKVHVKLKDVLHYIKALNRAKPYVNEEADPELKADAEERVLDALAAVTCSILEQGEEDLSADDIDGLVAFNLTSLSRELPITLGMATREQVEAVEAPKN